MPENEQEPQKKPDVEVMKIAYPSNSNKSKREEPKEGKKVQKLEGVNAVKRKPSLLKRIRQSFTGDDTRTVGDFLLFEVAIPAIKTMLYDTFTQGLSRSLWGRGVGAPGAGNRRPGVVNYNRISHDAREQQSITVTQRDRASHDFDGVTFGTRGEAEKVLTYLMDIIDQYDFVSVQDLYEMVGIVPGFTDNRWGWYELTGADIVPVRDGFILDLPPTKPIR